MPGTPRRVHGPATVSNVAATKYTVPATLRAVIRKIHVANSTAGAIAFTCSIGADAAGTRIVNADSIPASAAGAQSTRDYYGPYTLAAAEIIQALTDGAGGILTLTIEAEESVA